MGKIDKKEEMSFWEHLEELRWVLVRSSLAIVVAAATSFVFYQFIFDCIIFAPMSPNFITNKTLCRLSELFNSPVLCINKQPLQIININLAGQFTMHLVSSIYSGIIIAFPYIIFQLWQFIKPALYPNERRKSRKAVFVISFLFFVGVLFGYYIITPITMHFLGTYSVSTDVTNTISLNSYISSITSATLASGIVFELPVLVIFLTQTGIITPSFLKKYRRHSLVAIMVLAAIITPPDVISLILVVVPLWALFEISLLVSTRLYNKKMKLREE
jgi:sec-independent protein translocase protein TatC